MVQFLSRACKVYMWLTSVVWSRFMGGWK